VSSVYLAGPLGWSPVTNAWHDAVLLPAVRAACGCPEAVNQGVAFACLRNSAISLRECCFGGTE